MLALSSVIMAIPRTQKPRSQKASPASSDFRELCCRLELAHRCNSGVGGGGCGEGGGKPHLVVAPDGRERDPHERQRDHHDDAVQRAHHDAVATLTDPVEEDAWTGTCGLWRLVWSAVVRIWTNAVVMVGNKLLEKWEESAGNSGKWAYRWRTGRRSRST